MSFGVFLRSFATKTEAEKMSKLLARKVLNNKEDIDFFQIQRKVYRLNNGSYSRPCFILRFFVKDYRASIGFSYTKANAYGLFHVPVRCPATRLRSFIDGYMTKRA